MKMIKRYAGILMMLTLLVLSSTYKCNFLGADNKQ